MTDENGRLIILLNGEENRTMAHDTISLTKNLGYYDGKQE